MNKLSREKLIKIMRELSLSYGVHELDEQAVPSYLSKVSMLRFTFWRRVELAVRVIQEKPAPRVLDFGCGLGALFPSLSQCTKEFYAYEKFPTVLASAKKLAERLEIKNVCFLENETELDELADGSLDVIVALDVLEHVKELDKLLEIFHKKLNSSGRLIVCSPTEYWYYRLARKFGGEGYRGEYHEKAADQVEEDIRRFFHVRVAARIYPILTFFRIVTCTKKV